MTKIAFAAKILASTTVLVGAALAAPAISARVAPAFEGAFKALAEGGFSGGLTAGVTGEGNASAGAEIGLDAEASVEGDAQAESESAPEGGQEGAVYVHLDAVTGGLAGLFGQTAATLSVEQMECAEAETRLTLAWDPRATLKAAGAADGVFRLYRDSVLLAELDSHTDAYVDVFPAGEEHTYRLELTAGAAVYWQETEGGCG